MVKIDIVWRMSPFLVLYGGFEAVTGEHDELDAQSLRSRVWGVGCQRFWDMTRIERTPVRSSAGNERELASSGRTKRFFGFVQRTLLGFDLICGSQVAYSHVLKRSLNSSFENYHAVIEED